MICLPPTNKQPPPIAKVGGGFFIKKAIFVSHLAQKTARIHENTVKRIELVLEIVRKYYEPGRLDRCHKEVWRRYVNPVYPMSYRTYLSYVGIDLEAAKKEMQPACLYYTSLFD